MKNLAALRKRAGLSQAELAAFAEAALPELPRVQILRQYITDMETGRNLNPAALIVLRLAAVLDCDPKALFIAPNEDAA